MPGGDRSLIANPLFMFGVGVVAGFVLRGVIQPTRLAAPGYHNGVWYDDAAATPIEHTIFGPFYNEYEDPDAGITPAGLTPPPSVDVRPTIA
jgi:hypothetical protein